MRILPLLLTVLLTADGWAQDTAQAPVRRPAAAARKKAQEYPPTMEGAQVEVYKTVGDVELQAWIFQPPHRTSNARAAIIFFFGGGWNSGSPTQFEPHCRYLAERGMVAIAADYRVANRHGVKVVSCLADAKSAIRWVRRNAAELGVDPQMIVAAGGSAGGHLAAATGCIAQFDEADEDTSVSSVPNAMALFNPALVLAPVSGEAALDEEKAAGMAARTGVEPKELSPYHQVHEGMPPTIIFHGKADSTVPYRSAELFANAMQRHGNRCQLIGYEDAGHGFFNHGRGNDQYYTETLQALDDFLVELKYLPAKE